MTDICDYNVETIGREIMIFHITGDYYIGFRIYSRLNKRCSRTTTNSYFSDYQLRTLRRETQALHLKRFFQFA